MSAPVLAVDGLSVSAGAQTLVCGVQFELHAGQALTVLGESGSGKTLMAQAIMAHLPPGLKAAGTVRLDGQPRTDAQRRQAWGRGIALLPQEPWAALDPTMQALPQVAEVHRWLQGMPHGEAVKRARDGLLGLGLPDNAHRRWPHQLSGGMAQRVALAATLAGGAPLLVVDEPTKGLDSLRRDQVAELLRGVLSRGGAVVTITHDVTLARLLGGQVIVMREASVVEQGPAVQVLQTPRQAYTRELLQADPAHWPARQPEATAATAASAPAASPLVDASGLGLSRGGQALFSSLDIAIRPGERWALSGPSGSGKTSLAQVLLGLLRPDHGRVRRQAGLPRLAFQKLYQDPLAAFAPRLTLRQALDDFLRLHGLPRERLHALREQLRLPEALLSRLPQAVSGGELQRLALLRVMLLQPALLVADEPTSRLDPLTQWQVLRVLDEQLAQNDTALLLITHDLALGAHLTDRQLHLGR